MPDDQSSIISENAAYWESLAPHRPGASLDEIRSLSVVDERELEALGDVAGKRVVHLAASVGDEAIQFALMGASVTAIDIAPSHVASGRSKADELHAAVDFRVGDMTNLPADIRDIDTFYISWGGLCWIPDLAAWVSHLAGRMRPGGRLVVAEHHPLWEMLTVASADTLAVTASYFDPTWRKLDDIDKRPQVVKEVGTQSAARATSFIWNLGELVSAFLAAGLRVAHLREYALPQLYPNLTEAAHLPAIYIAAAEAPMHLPLSAPANVAESRV